MKTHISKIKAYGMKILHVCVVVVFVLTVILMLDHSFRKYKTRCLDNLGFIRTDISSRETILKDNAGNLEAFLRGIPEESVSSFISSKQREENVSGITMYYFEYGGEIYGATYKESDADFYFIRKLSFENIDGFYSAVMRSVFIPISAFSVFILYCCLARVKKRKALSKENSSRVYLKEHFEEMIFLSSKLVESASNNDEKYLSDLLKFSLKVFPEADCGSISLIEEGKIRFIESVGHNLEKLQKLNIKSEYLANSNINTVIIDNLLEKNINRMPYPVFIGLKKASKPVKQSLISKFKLGDEPLGNISLDISNKKRSEFGDDSKQLIEGISSMISAFFAVKKNLDFREIMQKDLILSMISMLEIYDTYTKGHSENVANLAKKLARNMSLPDETVEEVYWSSLVHDIGKILIPTTILNKPDKLTNSEFEIIKMHPVWGYSVLKKSEELEYISINVRSHHERWDGNGYPDGLAGEEIPLVSRILAVADAYDAMTSDRAYRKGIDRREAVNEIKKSSGGQFDPYVVELFVKMMV